LMLDWLGESGMADNLEEAIRKVIAAGEIRTYDMGGSSSTLDVANAIVSQL
jgi:isocitrate/isopropylmalate dehydrogenase